MPSGKVCYLVVRCRVVNFDHFPKYKEIWDKVSKKYGAKPVMSLSHVASLVGPMDDRAVAIYEYQSPLDIIMQYQDPEYAPAIPLRKMCLVDLSQEIFSPL
jgi:uncharacterized protein (DUF1330 family)